MDAAPESTITLRDLLRVLFRHQKKFVFTFVAITAATLLAIMLCPRTYTSESKMFVRVGRESIGLDPTATTGQTINLQKYQEDEVNSVLELLESRAVAERVVDRLGAGTILHPPTESLNQPESKTMPIEGTLSQARGAFNELLTSIHLKDPISERERAVRELQSKLSAFAPKRNAVVTIAYTAATPENAQQIVSAATDAFLEQHSLLGRTEGSHAFFAEQTTEMREALVDAERSLSERKNEFGISDIPSRREILKTKLSEVELALLVADRELQVSTTRVEVLQSLVESLPEKMRSSSVVGANSVRDSMREMVYQLEIQEQELLSKRTAEHPAVKAITQQRDSINKILEEQPSEREQQSTIGLNPIRRDLEAQLLAERAARASTETRQLALQKQFAELGHARHQLNRQEVEIAGLERDVHVLRGNYALQVEHLEQARISEEIGAKNIRSIRVFQPASMVEKPVQPRKLLWLLCGLSLATVGAFAVTCAAEQLDETIRSPEQVEQLLDLPVLVSVPAGGWQGKVPAGGAASESTASLHGLSRRLPGLRPLSATQPAGRTLTIGVVRCGPDAPSANIARELAIDAIAQMGKRVLLVDADFHRRLVGTSFGANGGPGLTDILDGSAEPANCIVQPDVENLSLLTAGTNRQLSETVLDWRDISQKLDPLSEQYGMTIIDLPVCAAGSVGVESAADFDAIVLVVEAERTRIQAARRIHQRLIRAGANVLGVVLSGQRQHIPSWIYHRT